MSTEKQKSQTEIQTLINSTNENQKFDCRKIEITLPRNFVDDKHIDDCLVYKTKFCHMEYKDNTLVNITGEFFLRYTDKNKRQQKMIFPFTQSFLCDFFPYYIKIPSPAEIDFSGQEIKIYQSVIISERNIE